MRYLLNLHGRATKYSGALAPAAEARNVTHPPKYFGANILVVYRFTGSRDFPYLNARSKIEGTRGAASRSSTMQIIS